MADNAAADVLRLLADCESSGALELPGSPGGTFRFEAGRVTGIVTEAVPDLAARLGARDGPVRRDDLPAVARSVLVDAAAALLAHRSPVPPRFHDGTAGAGAPADGVRVEVRIDVHDLLAEAGEGLLRLTAAGLRPDDVVAVRAAPPGRGVRLGPVGWRLLAGLDTPRSPRALAWRLGLPLVDTVVALAALVDQGACENRGPPERPAAARPAGEGPAAARPAGERPAAARPAARRTEPPGAPRATTAPPADQRAADRVSSSGTAPRALPRRPVTGGRRQPARPEVVPPDPDVLDRLLRGLRRL